MQPDDVTVGPAHGEVWIVDDEPACVELAADICATAGLVARSFSAPGPCLQALSIKQAPAVIVLDWRLDNDVSAALFMALRHRYPQLPIVTWTGSRFADLPEMMRVDTHGRIVDKAAGAGDFLEALHWALEEHEITADAKRDASSWWPAWINREVTTASPVLNCMNDGG